MTRKKWYYFRRRTEPAVNWPIVYYFTPYNKKTVGVDVLTLNIAGADFGSQTIFELISYNKARDYLFSKLKKDPKLLIKVREQSNKFAAIWLKWCRSTLNYDLLCQKSLSDLIILYRQYVNNYEQYSDLQIKYWVFLPDRIDFLLRKELLKKYNISDVDKIILNISSPNETTGIEKIFSESRSILKEHNIKHDISYNNFRRKVYRANTLKTKLNFFLTKYRWLFWDYTGPRILGLKDIWDDYHHYKLTRQSSFDYKINRTARFLANQLTYLSLLQDDKKNVTTEFHYHLSILFKFIADKLNIKQVYLHCLNIDELEKLYRNRKYLNELKSRYKFCIALTKKHKSMIFSGRRARIILDKLGVDYEANFNSSDSFTGKTAYPGLVVGKVRILIKNTDIRKFKNGEILVTAMTTPDFVTAMRKARGIITNEGGITSHAAIVSRELQVPCVIGTKSATNILRTGDLVEMNATEGIIKIIKKSRSK